MKQYKILISCLIILSTSQAVFAQVREDPSHPLPEWVRRNAERRARMNEINGIGKNGMILNRDVNAPRRPVYQGMDNETKELMEAFERTKDMLVVPVNYYEKYKLLLKNKKVNLARLQPERNCYVGFLVTVKDLEKCANVVPIPGGGSYYSFRTKLNYPIEKTVVRTSSSSRVYDTIPYRKAGWWNIHFVDDIFKVENNSVQGIISEIGDIDLEKLNLTSKEFEFLNNFKLKNTQAEVTEQNEALKTGIKFNDFVYSNTASMKVNSTYVLRSIDYSQSHLQKLYPDKRADMTIAFKVVARESDESVIVLWKELKAERLKKSK